MNDVFVWEETGVDGRTRKPQLGVFVQNYANEPSFVRPATSADVAAALNAVGAEAVREVWHGLESRAYGVALISAHGALANAIRRAEEAERERDEAINRADRAEELLESACEPMDAARVQISLDHNLIMEVCELLGAKDEVLREAATRVVRERNEAIKRTEQAEAQAIEDRSARDEAQYRWGEALEELQVTKNLLMEERKSSGNEALQQLRGDLSYVKGSLSVKEHLVEVFRQGRTAAQEMAAAENKAATGLRLEIESIGKALGKHEDDESVLAAAERVVRARDRALDAQHIQMENEYRGVAVHPVEKARELLGAQPHESTPAAIERVVKERDEAIGREKELGIFFRTADRVISEVRSELGIPNGPHVVEEVARVVKERDETKRFMEVAHRQVDLDLSLITDVCEILGAKSANVLRETAARVVKERDELLERSQAMITEVLERLGADPMEPLRDLLNRVVQRSDESERIIASLSSSRKEFKDKLRECSQLLDEMREERDKAILKGLEEKNQTLGWLAAIPGVTVCALESVHDRIQRVKLEIDRLNRQLDLAKDRADKAEESRDEALDQLHEELRLAKEDRDLAVQKLQLMNAATLKNLKEFP